MPSGSVFNNITTLNKLKVSALATTLPPEQNMERMLSGASTKLAATVSKLLL